MVDDFAPWRHFVSEKLRENRSLRIVGVASDGLGAIQKAGELQPDLILLDVGLPKVNGIVAARRIRSVAPNSRILFLSQTFDSDVVQAALSEGGHGFLVKSDAESELLAAVNEVMHGRTFVSRRLNNSEMDDDSDSPVARQIDGDAIASPAIPLSVKREVGRCHEAHFYSDDSRFLDDFARFLSLALNAGNVAVFIGTPAHRIGLLERLHGENPDTRTAIREGRYVSLNATEFMSDFMTSDMPDVGWFLKVVDDLIVETRKVGNGEQSRVSVCGECAHLLWAQGKADAAIRLEELWNQVAKTYDVDILCGYSLENLRSEEDGYTLRRISEEHSAIHSL